MGSIGFGRNARPCRGEITHIYGAPRPDARRGGGSLWQLVAGGLGATFGLALELVEQGAEVTLIERCLQQRHRLVQTRAVERAAGAQDGGAIHLRVAALP